MKIGCTDCIKFKRLKRRLKLAEWQCVGLLESIWKFTARNAPQGDIGRFSDDDIAADIEWDGDASELISILVQERWLDESESCRLVVHDWQDHAPTWIKGRNAAESARSDRFDSAGSKTGTKEQPKTGSKTPPKDATEIATKTTPKADPKTGSTIPNHTIPYHTTPTKEALPADQESKPTRATEAGLPTWGLVAERMKKLGVGRITPTLEAAKTNGFVPPQVIALIDWLEQQPSGAYQPGTLVERLSSPDAAEWDCHENWPPPAGTVVRSGPASPYEPSAAQTQLSEKNRKQREAELKAKAAEIERLNAEHGPVLDAMSDDEVIELIGNNVILKDELLKEGRDGPVRGILLLKLAQRLAS